MKRQRLWRLSIFLVLGILWWSGWVLGRQVLASQTFSPPRPSTHLVAAPKSTASRKKERFQPFEQVVKNAQKQEGLFSLYQNDETGKLYLEIQPDQLDKDFLCIITLSRGIGDGFLLNGLSLDSFLFRFQRVGNKVQFVRPNVNFRASGNDLTARSLSRSFSDSVLYALDIQSIHPTRKSLLIDLSDLFLSRDDLSGLTQILPSLLGTSYSLDPDKSYFSDSQAFPLNLEVEATYGFSAKGDSEGLLDLPTLPDSRSFNLAIHYSLSELPASNGYIPRLADDRIGYFITAYKELSEESEPEPFVRYIQRWDLQPSNPSLPLSPPRKPIVFWIENTVPQKYRKAVEEGILMWNAAFEQAGFQNAIEVRQMPDDAQWNPADVRYNTIRWSSSLEAAFLGIGPSHVNPLTGQILDADIVIDANVVRSASDEFRDLVSLNQPEAETSRPRNHCTGWVLTGGDMPPTSWANGRSRSEKLLEEKDFCFSLGAKQQFQVGSLALSLNDDLGIDRDRLEDYVNQFIRLLVSHEVGHTLGLRHNFHGSTLLMPQQLNDRSITHSHGMAGSVMDYLAVNLAPQGVEQGDYFPVIVGPYDRWAIEYGYKPSGKKFPQAEGRFLANIARRSSQPELAYATDEDVYGFLDPEVNAFDLSGDVLLYAQWQMDNARAMWERLPKRYPKLGESYSEVRSKFNEIFFYYFQQALLVSKYIGGNSFNRDRPGTPEARLPFEPIPAEKQHQALTVLQNYVFSRNAFNFPPELLNQLAPSRWNHWGQPVPVSRLDYPILDNILALQKRVLRSLLSNDRLNRLRNLELKTSPGQALTLPELFETLQAGIWTEVMEPDEEDLSISSVRRSLQREYLDMVIAMVLRRSPVPEDARTIAWYQLDLLEQRIERTLGRYEDDIDTYSKAHLAESRDRILKALDAPLQSKKLGKG